MLPLLTLLIFPASTPPAKLPTWAQTIWQSANLSQTYARGTYLPSDLIQADFNGDGKQDVALLITRKSTHSRGILFLHQGEALYHVVGAGPATSPDILRGDFAWATQWSLYTKPTTFAITFDKSGDVSGDRPIRLQRPAIELIKEESGGGMIYWNGKRYTWIHQTC